MFDNVLVFLQISMSSVKSEPGSRSHSCRTSDDDDDGGGDEVTAVKVQEDAHVDKEQNPVPITFNENEVSIFCVSIIQ
jgi:hypothetical protein